MAPASSDAASFAAKLGLDAAACRRTVTIDAAGTVLDGESSLRGDAVSAVALLNQVAEVHLLVRVADAATRKAITEELFTAGVIRDESGPQLRPEGPYGRPQKVGSHKVLFHSTEVGKVAIVRQLRPALHIDSDAATLETLRPHVKNLLQVVPGGDSHKEGPQGWPVASRSWLLKAA